MLQLEPIESVLSELCISNEELMDTITKLEVDILIEPQPGIEIYITNKKPTNGRKPFFERITEDGVLLCISTNELTEGDFTSEFSHIAHFNAGQYEIHSPISWKLKKLQKELASTNNRSFAAAARESLSASNSQTLQNHNNTFDLAFTTFNASKYNTTKEPLDTKKPIALRETKKFLRKKDIELIKAALRQGQPKYGVFVPGEWTSSALKILNEASTYFFCDDHQATKKLSKDTREAIENWLIIKWREKGLSHGVDLAKEARKLITPSNISIIQIERRKFDAETLSQYNNYDSNCLIAINETARSLNGKKSKCIRMEVIEHLISTYQITKKSAVMAATIILSP